MPKTYSKTCIACQTTFIAKRSDAVLCSKRCHNRRQKYYLRKKYGEPRSRRDRRRFKEQGLCSCGRPPLLGFKLCAKCQESGKRASRKRKAMILAEYGGKCACCGELDSRFLAIDHINNDGASHRRSLGTKSSFGIHRYLIQNGYPKDNFQLLCYNCNIGKAQNGGTCPHALERTEELHSLKTARAEAETTNKPLITYLTA